DLHGARQAWTVAGECRRARWAERSAGRTEAIDSCTTSRHWNARASLRTCRFARCKSRVWCNSSTRGTPSRSSPAIARNARDGVPLVEENTVPFITRYRKERTGGLNEE